MSAIQVGTVLTLAFALAVQGPICVALSVLTYHDEAYGNTRGKTSVLKLYKEAKAHTGNINKEELYLVPVFFYAMTACAFLLTSVIFMVFGIEGYTPSKVYWTKVDVLTPGQPDSDVMIGALCVMGMDVLFFLRLFHMLTSRSFCCGISRAVAPAGKDHNTDGDKWCGL